MKNIIVGFGIKTGGAFDFKYSSYELCPIFLSFDKDEKIIPKDLPYF